jgi:hypothetical protein
MNSKNQSVPVARAPEPIPSKLSRGDTKRSTFECLELSRRKAEKNSRKEVIQPQVLLQLPCYDFTPITDHTLGGFLSCESEHRLLVQPTFVM